MGMFAAAPGHMINGGERYQLRTTSDFANWLSMNLALPPFDDVHVRKAVNFAFDKAAYQHVNGGHIEGDPSGHLAWDSLEQNLLIDYDPYRTTGSRKIRDVAVQT